MTNPISKAIVKAAVAMGYGKAKDYKGGSVSDILEEFAAIASNNSPGGKIIDGTVDMDTGVGIIDKGLTAEDFVGATIHLSVRDTDTYISVLSVIDVNEGLYIVCMDGLTPGESGYNPETGTITPV